MIFTIISQNKKDISQIQIPKENSKVVKEDNLGEHVFFVQLDSELPMPHFYINISKEKKKIENIGGIKNSYFGNKIGNDDNPDSERSKQISDIVNMSPEVIQKGIDRPFSRNQQDAKQFMNNYTGMPSAFISNMSPVPKHSRLKSLSYNDKVADQKPVEPPIAQKVTETEETYFLGDTNNGREMFWFKWDTFESWKYSFKDDTWSLLEDAKPPNKFLYFSST